LSRRLSVYGFEKGSKLKYIREKSAEAKEKVKAVLDFLDDDSNSVMSPGKKNLFSRGKSRK